ncbi:MAG TPA: helix-turn-helix domain-containing protein [Candidatus Dojkabacteria bacterium]|nr:helix-turn-helix domain-containing protein [Candidatus Dojkabacteria bacterium]
MSIINDVLVQAGLDTKEAAVYNTLLSNGGLTVLEIANKSGQKRTNLYNILENLKNQNLVKEVKQDSTTKYFPQSPREIEKLLERKSQMIHHAKLNYEILINSLQSQFTLIEQKPLITIFEGLKGLQRLYDDVNDTGEDILLLRSTFDDKRKDVDSIIATQMVEQVKRGIHAKVIGPLESIEETKALYTKYDKVRLVEERFIKNFPFNLPAQIIIYGTKTAISTIRKDIIITIIDHKDVTETYRVLFNFIWKYSTPEHNEIVKDWVQE